MARVLRALAPALVCLLALSACGSGSVADSAPPAAAISAPVEPEARKSSVSSQALSGVSPEAANGYAGALSEMGPAFARFTDDYQAAVMAKDAAAVVASARALHDAILAFDAQVRGLDLAAVAPQVEQLLALDEQFIGTLGEAAKARSGKEAIRIMEMLPFNEFTEAFTAVSDAL